MMKPIVINLCPRDFQTVRRDSPGQLSKMDATQQFHPRPWLTADFREILRSPYASGYWAKGKDGSSLGYILWEDIPDTACTAIVRLAVRADVRRRTVASQLLRTLRMLHGNRQMQAWIPETAVPAQCFFKKHGFRYQETERQHFVYDLPNGNKDYEAGYLLSTNPRPGMYVPKGECTVDLTNRISEYLCPGPEEE